MAWFDRWREYNMCPVKAPGAGLFNKEQIIDNPIYMLG